MMWCYPVLDTCQIAVRYVSDGADTGWWDTRYWRVYASYLDSISPLFHGMLCKGMGLGDGY